MDPMPTASARLKRDTQELHNLLERQPFMRSLLRGQVPRSGYHAYLESLSILHGVLETLCSRSTDEAVEAVWREEMRKLPWLLEDTAVLQDETLRVATAPIAASLQCVQSVRKDSLVQPSRLIGMLYVLEGATHGGRLLAGPVARSLDLPKGRGTRYLENYGAGQPAAWKAFVERLDETVQDEELYREVLRGAEWIYQGISAIAASLEENGAKARVHATSFNPEAGSHAVPQDEAEIRAVAEAAEACLAKFPYVRIRYGDRGVRYTHSDGAWLVTLTCLPQRLVLKQVDWLAGLLGALGMPRVILEDHLRETERALNRACPGNRDQHGVLSAAADHLARRRDEALCPFDQARVREELQSSLPADVSVPDRLTDLWISMIADEILDVNGALDKTLLWMENESPWSPAVAEACRRSFERILVPAGREGEAP